MCKLRCSGLGNAVSIGSYTCRNANDLGFICNEDPIWSRFGQ